MVNEHGGHQAAGAGQREPLDHGGSVSPSLFRGSARNGNNNACAARSEISGTLCRAWGDKLRATGKPAKQTLVACMRKLLVILNAILRDREPWKTA
jgi:hypothetical protein